MKLVTIALAAWLAGAGPALAEPRPQPARRTDPPATEMAPAAARVASSLLPHRLLYVIPAGTERTVSAETPELRALQDTLAALFVASVRAELLPCFSDYTVVRATAAQDSLLAAALADRSLFNRYDDLLVARVTLSGTGIDLVRGRIHARVVAAIRPWDPADALTLTGEGSGGSAEATLLEAAGSALHEATRAVTRTLQRQKSRLVR